MFLLAQFGSAEAVVERARALIAKEREVGELNAIPALLMAQAVASLFTCRWDDAESLFEEAVVLAREVGLPAVTAQHLAFHVPALRGDYDRAKVLIAQAASNPGSTINDGAETTPVFCPRHGGCGAFSEAWRDSRPRSVLLRSCSMKANTRILSFMPGFSSD